jgi:hypothetical protein
MPITFYGKWSLDVIGNVGEFDQRVRIMGSVASDGSVSGAVGTRVAEIDGDGWNVFLERSSDGGVTWLPNVVQRIPSVTPKDGLIITLFGDDAIVPPQDSDVTVQFVYLNQQVNPPGPTQPPYSFTLPPGQFWPKRPPEPCPCCCKCPCTCRVTKTPKRGCC